MRSILLPYAVPKNAHQKPIVPIAPKPLPNSQNRGRQGAIKTPTKLCCRTLPILTEVLRIGELPKLTHNIKKISVVQKSRNQTVKTGFLLITALFYHSFSQLYRSQVKHRIFEQLLNSIILKIMVCKSVKNECRIP